MKITKYLPSLCLMAILGWNNPTAAADKVVIGIGEITSSIYGADPVSFQTMLETQLIKTNKFQIIERNRLAEILAEQSLSVSGLAEGSGSFGGVSGVDYLVYGSITKFGEAKSGSGFRKFAVASSKFVMGVDIRIVDSATGEIIAADTVDREIKSGSAIAAKGFSTGSSSGDPLADVQRLTAQDITALIVTTIYPVKVATIQSDGTVILTYGNSIFSEGDLVRIFEMGEGFIDPDTGEILGAEEIEIGMLEVTEALPKFSKAVIVSGVAIKSATGRKMSPSEMKKYRKDNKKKRKRLP